MARALAAAHDKGIVHRDLKPANVFLHNQPGEDARVVKVLDFGVSKNLLSADGLRTVVGNPIGSPLYMSPEQACAHPDVDGRADIWSLGVVLFEMLTGERPFDGDATEVLKKILNAEIPVVSRRVRGVDPEFERLIAACLCRKREHRPWPASEVASMLDAFVKGSGRAPLTGLAESSASREDVTPHAAASSTERLSLGHLGAMVKPPLPPSSADDDGEDAATHKLQIGMLAQVAPRPSASRDVEHEKVEPPAPALLPTPAAAESPHGSAAALSGGGDLKGLAHTVRMTPNEALQFNPSEARATSVAFPGPASPVPALMAVEAAKAPAGAGLPSFSTFIFGDRVRMKKIAVVAGGSLVASTMVLALLLRTPSKAESAPAGEVAAAPSAPVATAPSTAVEAPAGLEPGAAASAPGSAAPSPAPANGGITEEKMADKDPQSVVPKEQVKKPQQAVRPGPAVLHIQPPTVRKPLPPPCPKSTFGLKKGCRG
ncbi:MAG: serine/threonine-protein kinase [Minicystis sp.]